MHYSKEGAFVATAKKRQIIQKKSAKAADKPTEKKSVSFDHVKGPLFRGIHVDGAWGGPTPHGQLAFTFFSERFPIPQQITYELAESGSLGKEIERVSRSSIVRDAEVCVYMNLGTAKALRSLLDMHIKELEKARRGNDD